MKRLLLAVAVCSVVASPSFAQKKAVKTALSISKSDKANYDEARTLIKGALENAETKDAAATWFAAGFVENQQFDSERLKQVLGQKPNDVVMYTALGGIMPYFTKALELDAMPNEKGKVKPKHTKDIKNIIAANHVYYINGGAYYFEQKDYKKAYDLFKQYTDISESDLFKDNETVSAKDSNYLQIKFYSAVAASQMGETQLAIDGYEALKPFDYRSNEIYQYLCYEYEKAKDTVNFAKTLEEGVLKFPEEEYYTNTLINIYIYSNQNEKALKYISSALAQKPSAQLYDVMGRVYETGLKNNEKAVECFNKALELDPTYTDALGNLGRVYYNDGVNKLGDANAINDNAEYKVALDKAKSLFEQARPYFEKAHKAKPEDKDYMVALRSIYYNLNMGEEFKAIEAAMNK
jgi:tetratricopeptide (TPR) repeat protein